MKRFRTNLSVAEVNSIGRQLKVLYKEKSMHKAKIKILKKQISEEKKNDSQRNNH